MTKTKRKETLSRIVRSYDEDDLYEKIIKAKYLGWKIDGSIVYNGTVYFQRMNKTYYSH